MVNQAHGGEEMVEINWKPFSLDQVNQKVGDDYKAWEEPDETLGGGLWGHRAGIAANRQGGDPSKRFLPLLLKARHEDRIELNDLDALKAVAKEAGLDVERFEKDVCDRATLEEVAKSHTEAVEELGVFGTPTFVFEGGGSAFVKMLKPENPEDADKAFEGLMALVKSDVYIGEVKRPQPPWPRGIGGR